MKKIINLVAMAFILAIPMACECETIAFSPSNPGQPLIFHFNTAFNTIHPSQFSAVTWTQLENALLIRSSYSQHLDNICHRNCCDQWNFWADGMAQWQHQDKGRQHQFDYNSITGGLTIGADTCYNDFLVGVAASYTYSNLRWEESVGNSKIDSYYGGLYGSWNKECFYVNAFALAAYNDYHKSRHFHSRSVERHAHVRHNGWEALTGIKAGVMFQELFCDIDLGPFAGVDYVYLSQERHREHGADRFNLHVRQRDDQLLQSEVGLQFRRRILCELWYNNWILVPNLSLSYINQTALAKNPYHSKFVDRDNEFSVKGWDFNRNLGAVAFNVNFLDCMETINLTVHYEGQFGKNYWNQAGSLMGNLCF